MKIIILYCSKSGKTEQLAKKIQTALGSDILKVEPEKPYGNFLASVIRVIRENSKHIAPTVKTEIPNLDGYDVVFAGYPVWAGKLPPFFSGFLQKCNVRGKTVIPFATSGGSGIESTIQNFKSFCPESNVVLPYHSSKKDNFDTWIQSIRSDVLKS